MLCRSHLRRTYEHDDDDGVAVDGPRISAWLQVHGTGELPSLCMPHLFAYAITCGDASALQWLADAGLLMWAKGGLVLDARDCKACPRAIKDLGPAMKMRSSNNIVRAATKGHVDALAFLIGIGFAADDDIWAAVCTGGHWDVAAFVVAHGLGVWDDAYINITAKNGHFDLLQYLLGLGYTGANHETLALGIEHDQLTTVQDLLLHRRTTLLSVENALKDPVVYRRVGILRWLCQQLEARACLAAAKAMALYYCAPAALRCINDAMARQSTERCLRSVLLSKALLTFIGSYQAGCDGSTVALHAICKDLPLYSSDGLGVPATSDFASYLAHFTLWRARHGLSQLRDLCDQLDHCKVAYCGVVEHAAESGHVGLVAMLRDAGFSMDSVWYRACLFGHLNIAQFAHEHQLAGWGRNFIYTTAANGHLDVIRFFHEHNYDGFSDHTIRGAVYSSNTDLVQFLLTHRANDSTLRTAMNMAAETDKLEIVMLLCDQPNASQWVDEALRGAYVTRSHRCVAHLKSLPGESTATIHLFERAFKRKAVEMA
ncbi:hypothetical protein SDRG_13509 [Saprolegnia diclina VS20]|uniref:Ankyrin repeat protein n=1 Tax=Saprolegnia diclina (strain VS20) TaxID=1156394 RepID=T0PTJ0_SAPDV|nr:hypothetical protein SDRG_13509 [Saprolegnia diclina VS20]EQC28829.1 hypothetical protein SDRG_13509 [Saprolegnia diclina VS20]|eukprot:XP_008617824.1 hypothetical protein SDRG_13509 [Saprolegnia diclina VS20]